MKKSDVTCVKSTFVFGRSGADDFVFQGTTAAGDPVSVAVSPKTIIDLGFFLMFTDNPRHAAWHLENQEEEVPCSGCDKTFSNST